MGRTSARAYTQFTLHHISETLPPDPNLSANVSTRTRAKKGKGKAPTVPEAEVDRLSIDPFQPSSSLRRSILPINPTHSDASDDASPEPVNLEPNQPDSGYQDDSTTPTPSTHTGTTEEVPRHTEPLEPHIGMADNNNNHNNNNGATPPMSGMDPGTWTQILQAIAATIQGAQSPVNSNNPLRRGSPGPPGPPALQAHREKAIPPAAILPGSLPTLGCSTQTCLRNGEKVMW